LHCIRSAHQIPQGQIHKHGINNDWLGNRVDSWENFNSLLMDVGEMESCCQCLSDKTRKIGGLNQVSEDFEAELHSLD